MQSENFDNKIRQAAEQHHPNYDEMAWSKMEKLLDEHMPRKDDRRRIFFLLFLFLLTGGGAWLLFSKPWNDNAHGTAVKNSTNNIQSKPADNSAVKKVESPAQQMTAGNDKPTDESKTVASSTNELSDNKQTSPQISAFKPGALSPSTTKKSLRKNDNRDDQLSVDVTNPAITDNTKPAKNNDAIVSPPIKGQVTNNDNNKNGSDKPVNTDVVAGNKPNEPSKEKAPGQQQKATIAKGNNKKQNSLFFSISAGPDVSSVDMSNPGEVKLLTGLGLGYSFKDRWVIRSGFYSSRKVYTATKYDYKPPTPIVNSNYLDQIDADCKVYEIPLNLSYNFSRSDQHSIFGTVGLSSFIMKKEVYKYLYQYPGNPPVTYTYTKTINNEYKHYFSVLTLSGGYAYKFNKILSLSAEPYLKLPLAGVGFGKVKLNSAGVQFSANIRLFH